MSEPLNKPALFLGLGGLLSINLALGLWHWTETPLSWIRGFVIFGLALTIVGFFRMREKI